MKTLFTTNQIYSLNEIKSIVHAQLRQLPSMISTIGFSRKMFRFEFPCEDINVLTWLHNQKTDEKVYWADRNNEFEMGGIGIADCFEQHNSVNVANTFEYFDEQLSFNNPNLRYYGGFSFSHESSSETDWQDFGLARFIIPQFELFKKETHACFALNIALCDITQEKIDEILTILEGINFSSTTQYRPTPKVCLRTDFPNRESWNKTFGKVIKNIHHKEYEKIVLARKSVFNFDVTINPIALIKHLKDKTPNCFHFCFQTNKNTAFLGASPEQLYKRENNALTTEALAGTRPRCEDRKTDNALSESLINSSKDEREHKYVVDAIKSSLSPLCTSLNNDDHFKLLKLQGGQHLVTRFSGTLKDRIENAQILGAIHPTPAVGGTPTQVALKTIQKTEPFDRGWYAGPVGYIGFDSSEFSVAIRSGLINHNRLTLYAGAGIVDGSTAQSEWDEIEGKISNFINVFDECATSAQAGI